MDFEKLTPMMHALAAHMKITAIIESMSPEQKDAYSKCISEKVKSCKQNIEGVPDEYLEEFIKLLLMNS